MGKHFGQNFGQARWAELWDSTFGRNCGQAILGKTLGTPVWASPFEQNIWVTTFMLRGETGEGVGLPKVLGGLPKVLWGLPKVLGGSAQSSAQSVAQSVRPKIGAWLPKVLPKMFGGLPKTSAQNLLGVCPKFWVVCPKLSAQNVDRKNTYKLTIHCNQQRLKRILGSTLGSTLGRHPQILGRPPGRPPPKFWAGTPPKLWADPAPTLWTDPPSPPKNKNFGHSAHPTNLACQFGNRFGVPVRHAV